AVFYPNIYKYRQIFMQEGWHYDLETPDSELTINGVVYSEMKGATSSPDRAIWEAISAAMFPDTTYGYNSGGDPAVIPELTYEYYLNFHRRYYHPSNSYIFVYGNCDMDERLEWMDENYLSAFDAIEPNSDISRQTLRGTTEPMRVRDTYSVGTTDELEGKSYLAYTTMGGSNLDVLDCRAWHILSSVLLNNDGAPIKKALVDAGIGEDIYGGYDSHMIEDTFAVVAKNASPEDLDRFHQIITDTLKKQIEEGVNEKALLACINRREFSFREADYGGHPKGLDYAANMLQSWLYKEDGAFDYMHTLADYAELKKRIGTGYYEDLIRRHVLESEHQALIVLEPERGLVDKKNEELKQKLADYKASLSDEEIAHLVEETRLLREYQSREADEAELNCIPSIQRTDIPRDTIPYYNRETTVGGLKTVFHDVETNDITYADIFFDMGKIPHKYVPYVGLLGYLIGRMDTASHTYDELDTEIKLNTGNLSFWHHTIRKFGTMDEYVPYYGIYAKMMPENADFALSTALEIITTTKFDDVKRIKAVLNEIRSDKHSEIMQSGNAIAAARARSYFSRLDCYNQDIGGLNFYFFICDLLDNFDEKSAEIVENLKKVTAYIFNPEKITVSLAADEAGVAAMDAALTKLTAGLAAIPHDSLGDAEEYVPVKKNEGILIPSQVQYVARVGNLGFDGMEYNAAFNVVKTAVNIDWLYQQIRVKGGAYGCGCGFGGDSGNVQFTSYRDPKLTETFEVYGKTGDFVRTVKFDERELTKYIIGTFSGYERPMSPAGKASRSMNAYLSGRPFEDVLRERAQMLDITEEQFRSAADVFDRICAQGYTCAVGSEQKLRENADMFDNLVTIN
ncbi:MAG: insulinase family protein, partial [Clostridia bacterium]|nr:insulinase family protein [Clostridia bacterium]